MPSAAKTNSLKAMPKPYVLETPKNVREKPMCRSDEHDSPRGFTPEEADAHAKFVDEAFEADPEPLAKLRATIKQAEGIADAAPADDLFAVGWLWGLEHALCLLYPDAPECGMWKPLVDEEEPDA